MLLQVTKSWDDGRDIRFFELRSPDGAELAAFTPGAHVDLELGGGLVRQYSLLNDSDERDRYVIAVAREPASRGGSIWLHDRLAVGDLVPVGAPRSHFALREDARHSVLIAGGIGITPIWCMAQRLIRLGRSWELHYAARDRDGAALLTEIEALAGRATLYFSRSEGGMRIDLDTVIDAAPPGAHFYFCGPAAMLDAFRAACAGLPDDHVHFEQFTAAAPIASDGGYTIELVRSGREIEVEPGETILDAFKRVGLRATFSCREGVCGSCETGVVSGTPDHRDAVLTDAERAEGKTMMICCSGSLTERLVLDL
jgi:vanillate O-demethylase ferredoxin subunit